MYQQFSFWWDVFRNVALLYHHFKSSCEILGFELFEFEMFAVYGGFTEELGEQEQNKGELNCPLFKGRAIIAKNNLIGV